MVSCALRLVPDSDDVSHDLQPMKAALLIEQERRHLATDYHVAGISGLPAGQLTRTFVPSKSHQTGDGVKRRHRG